MLVHHNSVYCRDLSRYIMPCLIYLAAAAVAPAFIHGGYHLHRDHRVRPMWTVNISGCALRGRRIAPQRPWIWRRHEIEGDGRWPWMEGMGASWDRGGRWRVSLSLWTNTNIGKQLEILVAVGTWVGPSNWCCAAKEKLWSPGSQSFRWCPASPAALHASPIAKSQRRSGII